MKEYYYAEGEERRGPFSIEDLVEKGLDKSTLVWCEGMANWKAIADLPELNSAFAKLPPPVLENPGLKNENLLDENLTTTPNRFSKPPKNYLVESILATLFCCMPFGLAGIVYASKVEGLHHAGNRSEAIEMAEKAKKWTTASLICGLVVIVFYVIILIAEG